MRFLYSIFLSALAVLAQLSFQASAKISQACPQVWNTISAELTRVFLSNNTCNADARAAIRAAFHDCFPDGNCNGSIFLAGELSRLENEGIAPTVWMLGSLAKRHQVGVADMLQFAAGKSHQHTHLQYQILDLTDLLSFSPCNRYLRPRTASNRTSGACRLLHSCSI
jgi:hypothetical protein